MASAVAQMQDVAWNFNSPQYLLSTPSFIQHILADPLSRQTLQPGIKVQKSCQSAGEGRARESVSIRTELQTAL